MISAHLRAWRDYVAVEDLGDGSVRPLGSFSAKVGTAFDTALQQWPDVFVAGRGRVVVDERPGCRGLEATRA